MRGYVAAPATPWPLPIDADAVADALGRQGLLTVVKDLGLRGLYQGAVAVQGGDVGASLMHYFEKSEQVPTVAQLGVALDERRRCWLRPAGCSSSRCPEPVPGVLQQVAGNLASPAAAGQLIWPPATRLSKSWPKR